MTKVNKRHVDLELWEQLWEVHCQFNQQGEPRNYANPQQVWLNGSAYKDRAVMKYNHLVSSKLLHEEDMCLVCSRVKGSLETALLVYTDEGTLILRNEGDSLEYLDNETRFEITQKVGSTEWEQLPNESR